MGIVRVVQAKLQETFIVGMNLLVLNILGSMYRGLGYPHKSRDLHELAWEFHRNSYDLQSPDNESEKDPQYVQLETFFSQYIRKLIDSPRVTKELE